MMKNIITKHNVVIGVLMASLINLPAQASATAPKDHALSSEELHQEKVDNENIGFGTGAVIGAVVAGPIGAFVAGITGTLIAKHINVSNEAESLAISLLKAKEKNDIQLSEHKREMREIEREFQNQLASVSMSEQERNFESINSILMSLQFTTGSSDIAPHYQEQIAGVAELLNNEPEMKIDLSGYTDMFGEESINLNLSKERVTSVKKLLMAQGVNESQIATFAFGEKSPIAANKKQERNFYDRRVVLKIHHDHVQTAKR
ncbi:sortase-associated OmpA-like protein PdsO [Colwellia sp. RSH04]|nr:sortase-associated OmpA-like protein PdsO [Colwellia sp. RSH04]